MDEQPAPSAASRPDPTTRFTERVADYVRHRPSYPAAVIACLTREFGLRQEHVVADLGSGTGILTRMLLENDNRVYAVEPNDAMRAAAEDQLGEYLKALRACDDPASHFDPPHSPLGNGGGNTPAAAGGGRLVSVAGSAEATGLPDHCVDWVTAAQAFHWFDVDKARVECRRILRRGDRTIRHQTLADPGASGPVAPEQGAGWAAIIWNDRKRDTPFLQAYERFLLEFGTDFKAVRHEEAETDGRLERFFGGPEHPTSRALPQHGEPIAGYVRRSFDNQQILDEAGLRGRTLSASYMPGPDHPRRPAMLDALHDVFTAHQQSGRVVMGYEAHLYVGTLA